MSTRVGIGLARDAVRAVAVRRGRVLWAAESAFASGHDLADTITALLRSAPVPNFPRPTLSAAVGPHAAQLKTLSGLPATPDHAVLAALVRENAGTFFLRNGIPLLTVCSALPDGTVWAGAIDEPCVSAVRAAATRMRWRVGCVAPVHVLLVAALDDSTFTWVDGSLAVDVVRSGLTIEAVRTRPRVLSEPDPDPPHAVPGLSALGTDAPRYADAYGAALARRLIVGLDLSDTGSWSAAQHRARLRPPALVAMTALVALVLSPFGAIWTGYRARASLAGVPIEQRRTVAATLSRLDSVTKVLEDAGSFSASRVLITPLLGHLAARMPDGSVLVSFEVTRSGGRLVALTPDPTAVRAALEQISGVQDVEIVGPVRRETVAGRDAQRVTLQWRQGRP